MREPHEIIGDMIPVTLTKEQNFLIVKETLSRIGIQNWEKKVLYQSVHILQKKGRYYLTHFKTLLELDGNETNYSDEDRDRLLDIAYLMSRWDLVKLDKPLTPPGKNQFRVLKKAEMEGWTLRPKFTIGKFKKKPE